jgi:glycosyltransferase involved in cell wall biosynthesis
MLVYYIAEIDLPSRSAYAQHVLKMCDALSKKHDVSLLIFSKEINVSFLRIKKDYLLKNNFRIICLNHKKIKNTFFARLKFALFCKNLIKKESLIISRSIITSLYLDFYNIFNYLELHHNLKGITKIIFLLRRLFIRNIFFIFIHKNLLEIYPIKKNYLVLDDAVDAKDFKYSKLKFKYTFTYLGSLYPGKGLEIILYLAKEFPNYDFNIYGDISTIDKNTKRIINFNNFKNLKLNDHVNYRLAVKIIQKSRFLLMPYLNKVMVRSSNLEVSRFMSPLKMFDYLASGNILIASKLPVYSHILKHNYNCILVKPEDFLGWKNKISLILKKKINTNLISRNALLTAKKNTWSKRVEIIMDTYLNLRDI